MSHTPLAHLSALNADTDVRRERRALPAVEFEYLLTVTLVGENFLRLTAEDRVVLYLLAAYTGLRESELASLSVSSFDLNADSPTVTVEAGYSKRRRRDTLPLHPRLVTALRDWLPQRPQEKRVWAGSWWRKGAEMIRRDLKAAGIAYRDANERVFDFHALRGQFITQLGRQGVTLQDAQKLARHSDPRLTSNFYTHQGLDDLSRAVEQLPGRAKSLPAASSAECKPDRLALRLALKSDISCPDVSFAGPEGERDDANGSTERREKPLQKQGFDGDCHSLAASDSKRRRPDSNRGWRICNPLP